ncbi:biotin-dependent carboxyltransferase family protein [Pelagibacterium sp. 26DY04]|uniref:5-oxoprolinase subunit C family protein n=1 Tax=Pelagibacterium sp. 26DY04 TaxID=2967130 RepID=UPI0028168820|nr:biotin-dependent carboxyltransferase family protein [Pelagibacterium sp. 26DY04]WMT85199.1 biotin-dependent carboxyltransferase family protein [Pelagibacterium sp. 26DY04]
MSRIELLRVSPLTTIQDEGRIGLLSHGIGASGPMDRNGYRRAADVTNRACGAAIEVGPQGGDFIYRGCPLIAGFAGGVFILEVDGEPRPWPASVELVDGTRVFMRTGPAGNYGYIRFAAQIDVPEVLGSRSTNATVGLGGLKGRALRVGDALGLVALEADSPEPVRSKNEETGAIRFVWGIHAELFPSTVREAFIGTDFRVSPRMDRMGVRLENTASVFEKARILGLVSDAVVPGDIQILGDGTPIVLMRDNQPTGGYPRIGTIIDADMDRFAQTRPGQPVRFASVAVEHAHRIAGGRK